jgi:hypothetical protein
MMNIFSGGEKSWLRSLAWLAAMCALGLAVLCEFSCCVEWRYDRERDEVVKIEWLDDEAGLKFAASFFGILVFAISLIVVLIEAKSDLTALLYCVSVVIGLLPVILIARNFHHWYLLRTYKHDARWYILYIESDRPMRHGAGLFFIGSKCRYRIARSPTNAKDFPQHLA